MSNDDALLKLIQLSEKSIDEHSELSLKEAFDIDAREQAFANVRLSNLPITPELIAVYERHMNSEISLEEALNELGISTQKVTKSP